MVNRTYKILSYIIFTFVLFGGSTAARADWLQTLNGGQGYLHEPIFADLNGDGNKEILVVNTHKNGSSNYDYLHVFKSDGSPYIAANSDGFFAQDSGSPLFIPAVADIDNDGTKEVILTSTQGVSIYSNTGALIRKWSFLQTLGSAWQMNLPAQTPASGATVVADLDNDGKMEIVVPIVNTTSLKLPVMVYTYLGQPKSGFPINNPFKNSSFIKKVMISVADVLGDGYKQIVLLAPQTYKPNEAVTFSNSLSLINRFGQVLWNKDIDGRPMQAVMTADIDLDQIADVIVMSGDYRADYNLYGELSWLGRLLVYKGNGTTYLADETLDLGSFDAGGQLTSVSLNGDPVIADLNGDGLPEVVYASRYKVINSGNGTIMTDQSLIHVHRFFYGDVPGYPIFIDSSGNNGIASIGAVGDYDGNGTNEVLVTQQKIIPSGGSQPWTYIWPYQYNGQMIFPRALSLAWNVTPASCPPVDSSKLAAGDIDNNGKIDFVTVICGDTLNKSENSNVAVPSVAQGWPMAHFDAQNTRHYETNYTSTGNHLPYFEIVPPQILKDTPTVQFNIQAHDVDNDSLTYSVLNPPAGSTFNGQTFTWAPTKKDLGKLGYVVYFEAYDGHGKTQLPVKVRFKNKKPKLNKLGAQKIQANQQFAYAVSAKDKDGDMVTFEANAALPAGATFQGSIFSWKPTVNDIGDHMVIFMVNDGVDMSMKAMKIKVQ
jgi:hypothetical protein